MELTEEQLKELLERAFLEGYRFYEPHQSCLEVTIESQQVSSELIAEIGDGV